MIPDLELADEHEADLWLQSRKRDGFTPDFQEALVAYAESGRVGFSRKEGFCAWPNPPLYPPEKNVLWMQPVTQPIDAGVPQ